MRHLLIALSLAACAPAPPLPQPTPTLEPSPARGFLFGLRWQGTSFQSGYLSAAITAAEDWNREIGCPVFSWSDSGHVRLIQSRLKPSLNGKPADGITLPGEPDTIVILNAAVSEVGCYPVVAHELGHVLGLHHSDNPQDLMAPTVNPWSHITPNDARRAREALWTSFK